MSDPILHRSPLLTAEEAAQHLRRSSKTLEADRLRGSGPRFVKLGRSVRYRLSDLEAYIEKGLRRSTSDPGPVAPSPMSARRMR